MKKQIALSLLLSFFAASSASAIEGPMTPVEVANVIAHCAPEAKSLLDSAIGKSFIQSVSRKETRLDLNRSQLTYKFAFVGGGGFEGIRFLGALTIVQTTTDLSAGTVDTSPSTEWSCLMEKAE